MNHNSVSSSKSIQRPGVAQKMPCATPADVNLLRTCLQGTSVVEKLLTIMCHVCVITGLLCECHSLTTDLHTVVRLPPSVNLHRISAD